MATVRLRYVGPIDEIDLPLIRASLKRGDEFDGPEVLLEQLGNYELADKPKRAPAKRAPRKATKPKTTAPVVTAPTEGKDA